MQIGDKVKSKWTSLFYDKFDAIGTVVQIDSDGVVLRMDKSKRLVPFWLSQLDLPKRTSCCCLKTTLSQ